MNEEEIRNIVKSKLQNLSKTQLIDHLTDIYMDCTGIRMILGVNNISTDLRNAIGYNRRVNAQFALLQQTLNDLVKQQTESL